MNYISLFSGIEAASVAWMPLGLEPIAFSEIEKFPSDVLQTHFPEIPNLGDITKIDWSDFGPIDIVVGGSPCQSFSIAGNREGLAGESGLMFEYIRAVRSLMPRYFVWENVPGAFSVEKGYAFRQLLFEMDECGYGMAWRVLDAQFFGVPQRRRRVFLVGCLGDPKRAAEILFEPESMCWNFASSRKQREKLTSDATPGIETDCLNGWDCQSKRIYRQDGLAPTLSSGTGEGKNIAPSVLTYSIAGNIIGRSDKNGGHQFGVSSENDPMFTLDTTGGHGVVVMNGTQTKCAIDEELVGTITARSFKDAPVVYHDYTVRRLTPLECERLQGFPDGWTDIYENTPDTPRYKAIGNSMAVPVMRWIGERIINE